MKKDKKKWLMKLTTEHLTLISEALEFTSRFSSGQIGTTYLPMSLQNEIFFKNYDYEDNRKRSELYNTAGQILKTALYPELSATSNISYGIGKLNYCDNLYDMYKKINNLLYEYNNINLPPNERISNVNSTYSKHGTLESINITEIDE